MEPGFKDQFNRQLVTFRNTSRVDEFPAVGRLRLLEVVELRAMGWQAALRKRKRNAQWA